MSKHWLIESSKMAAIDFTYFRQKVRSFKRQLQLHDLAEISLLTFIRIRNITLNATRNKLKTNGWILCFDCLNFRSVLPLLAHNYIFNFFRFNFFTLKKEKSTRNS